MPYKIVSILINTYFRDYWHAAFSLRCINFGPKSVLRPPPVTFLVFKFVPKPLNVATETLHAHRSYNVVGIGQAHGFRVNASPSKPLAIATSNVAGAYVI